MSVLRTAIVATLLGVSTAAWAQTSAQTWKFGRSNEHPSATIASRTPGAALVFECVKGGMWMRYYPVRGWDGNGKAVVRAGGYTSAMVIDGGDGALLSNLPGNELGITRELVSAMKTSGSLVIEGSAANRVPIGQRSFALPDAQKVLSDLEKRCGGR